MSVSLIIHALALAAQPPASAQMPAQLVHEPASIEEREMQENAQHNIAVVKKMIAAWEARDAEAITNMFTEDGVLHSMMIDPIVGREDILPRMQFLVDNASHMHLNVRNWAVTGDTVFIERQDEFTFKGHEGKVPVVGVLVVEGDKIKEWREYYDRAELLEAMGVEGDF
ncbi:SgcJ/EcaC family oxidoreductase [Qipengyuania sp.]|uniref:SgcJ/EcaC family oxidoreductase n=1 Tax=Qipengyuania sp. TaxID=2004515 RepID=UPI0035C7E2FB